MTTKPAHFEVMVKRTGLPALIRTFPTYDAALTELTSDPLISANAHHPYFWKKMFEIVLCGGCYLEDAK